MRPCSRVPGSLTIVCLRLKIIYEPRGDVDSVLQHLLTSLPLSRLRFQICAEAQGHRHHLIIERIAVIESADPLLDAAARESFEQWRYEPFVVDGLPGQDTAHDDGPLCLAVAASWLPCRRANSGSLMAKDVGYQRIQDADQR